jgi:hypothetical protein
MENADVNTLIDTVNGLDTSRDPVTNVFVGDAAYLNQLAGQQDRNGNYLYPQLRFAWGLINRPGKSISVKDK